MQVFRCATCKKPVDSGWTFCPNCETFFDAPVAAQAAGVSETVYVAGADRSAYRSGKRFRSLVVCSLVAAIVGLLGFFYQGAGVGQLLAMEIGRPPGVAEAMWADMTAQKLGTLQAHMTEADTMIAVSSDCTVRHSPNGLVGDHVTLTCTGGVTPGRARARADFAAELYDDVRSRYMLPNDALNYSITVYDSVGNCMAQQNGQSFEALHLYGFR